MNLLKKVALPLMLVSSLILSSACGNKKIKPSGDGITASTEQSPNEGIVGTLNWYKNKGKKIDMEITLTNKYSTLVTFGSESFSMKSNDGEGNLKFQKFNGHLQPGQSETRLVSFEFKDGKKMEGPMTLTIGRFSSDDHKKMGDITLNFDSSKK
jgi:hypothetical protein